MKPYNEIESMIMINEMGDYRKGIDEFVENLLKSLHSKSIITDTERMEEIFLKRKVLATNRERIKQFAQEKDNGGRYYGKTKKIS